MHCCKQKKITELPQFKRTITVEGSICKNTSRGLRTIQAFCYCDTLHSSITRYNDYQGTKKTKSSGKKHNTL